HSNVCVSTATHWPAALSLHDALPISRPEIKRMDPSAQYAMIAAREAWADAGAPELEPERLGVVVSSGIGGIWTTLDAWDTLREKDRKSTRLNSSHVKNSYAVFCLKKK